MSEVEKIEITKSQYDALNEIRGLHQDAHTMVMVAKRVDSGYLLEGTAETFDHLVSDLSDELHYELSPKYRLKHLRTLMNRIYPDVEF